MPPFKYASFISYRHGQGIIKERFLGEFEVGLGAELELLRDEPVFVDRERLQGGDFYNEALARALYESATLIVIYQPNYFDLQHPYCAREYRAVCALEKERLAGIAEPADRDHGLIIPIVLRGERDLPTELRANRHCEDFSKFMLVDEQLSRHRDYAPKLRGIAEYIKRRCDSLDANGVPFEDAESFTLPSEEAVRPWIESLRLPRPAFPAGGGIS